MCFEYKQIIRFLKDGVCVEKFEGQPRGSSYRKTMKNYDPQKMLSKDLGLSKEYATKRKLELDQDLVFLLVSLLFY